MLAKKPYETMNGIEKNFISLYGEITEAQKNRYAKEFERFKSIFSENFAYVASSSGRVEVCGNHTDHNGGKVVSCAISLDTLAMFLPTDNDVIDIYSEGHTPISVNVNNLSKKELGTSKALVMGVVAGLKQKGYKVGGFKATFTSNVVGGAGISSSASFEVLIAEILNFLYNGGNISAEDKAIVSQYSENEYFGKPCGLLDQTAIAFGGLKKLDFATKGKIGVTDIKNSLSDYSLILINTGGSHAKLTGEYAAIPAEMFEVAKCFSKERLIDVSEDDFYGELPVIYSKLSDRAVGRAVHFYEENKRVDNLEKALNCDNYEEFLNCIKASGISSMCKLQNCYVAGSKEQSIPKALAVCEKFLCGGANRVHGGGFAGTILNVVKNSSTKEFIEKASAIFGEEKVIPLRVRSVGTIVL